MTAQFYFIKRSGSVACVTIWMWWMMTTMMMMTTMTMKQVDIKDHCDTLVNISNNMFDWSPSFHTLLQTNPTKKGMNLWMNHNGVAPRCSLKVTSTVQEITFALARYRSGLGIVRAIVWTGRTVILKHVAGQFGIWKSMITNPYCCQVENNLWFLWISWHVFSQVSLTLLGLHDLSFLLQDSILKSVRELVDAHQVGKLMGPNIGGESSLNCGWRNSSRWWFRHPYLGKIPNLTQRGWNHQPVLCLFSPPCQVRTMFMISLWLFLMYTVYNKKYVTYEI